MYTWHAFSGLYTSDLNAGTDNIHAFVPLW